MSTQLSPLNKAVQSWGQGAPMPTLTDIDYSALQTEGRARGSNRQFVRFYNKVFVEPYATEVKINDKTGSTQVMKTSTREVTYEMVEIITPGDKNTFDGRAEEFHRREFWRQYKAFRDGHMGPIGTSLDECEFVSPGVATELRYLGCQTLEQLADASDDLVNRIPDGWGLREFAKAKVKANMNNAQYSQILAVKTQLDKAVEAIEILKKQNDELKIEIAASKHASPLVQTIVREYVSDEPKRGPGRPRKEVEPTEG